MSYWFSQAAIFLLIAGTYTPFALGVLRGPWGWTLFGVVWGVAAVGVAAKLFDRLKHPLWSTGLYVAMGWVALIAVAPLVERMSASGLAWLVAGAVLAEPSSRFARSSWSELERNGSSALISASRWHSLTISVHTFSAAERFSSGGLLST